MDPEGKRFGRGPRELTGAVDLISHYKLLSHHQFFCKSSLPLSISDSHYLHNVVGDSEVMKGEGMQLDQLIQDTPYARETNVRIQPFDLPVLSKAFQLRETAAIDLSTAEKGVPTIAGKPKSESKDKERKHKKHKDKDREKDKEHKKHKHRHKDRSKDKYKEKKKDKSGHQEPGGGHTKKHHEKIGRGFAQSEYLPVDINVYRNKSRSEWPRIYCSLANRNVYRKGSMMEMKTLMAFRVTIKASIRAQRLLRLAP